ncbi:aldehyde dehydrogenase family protein [Granulosicoccus antarcticus]|uniref:3,6-anhydro-alpha-L-galactose dehydrogenase n=1 Tax=Granulosicoccus antarcticus IMCC3135 TaxID=1192854 RepID=A0A2Z2NHZ6_9GAMM|nr:aldehyde dehydrogenase family protein [Granulosicoccus antarcticus]ASJ70932.1 3,6-anhydro-alpha-L-galactose dehydrogenase [Granulosicoccus antarcticus IMCC3135]
MTYYRCFIDNEWVEAISGKRLSVDNPATGEVFAEVPACGAEDAERALQSSERARMQWALLPPVQRAGYLYKICDSLQAERDHFARLLVMEQGKTLAEAEFEVDDTIRYMGYAAEAARRIQGEILPADMPNEQLYIHRVPYGVTLGICAYNYPLALIGRKLGPALVAGNVMIIKPHESTPVTASEFCRLVEKAGLPKGVVNMVTGTGPELGQKLVESPITRMISVTGSIRAGQAIAAAAAKNLAALSLELGGNAPFIVLKDADIDAAVEAAAVARFANAGQVCICNESVLVEDSIAEEFTEKLLKRVAAVKLADPMTNTGMGPVTTAGSLERIQAMVARGVADGAEIAIGGKRGEGEQFGNGYWFEPTVLVNARADSETVTDELFGPVLPVVRIEGYEEALTIANNRQDGLSAYLWTRNPSIFMDAIKRLETGTIFLNKGIVGYVNGYHNGHKLSGLGGEDGTHGLEGYMQKRTVYMAY